MGQPAFKGTAAWRRQINSHETFTHDSLDSLGYDWSRIADPEVQPRFPLKIYLPQTTDDVVRVVNEVKQLGEQLVIRSKGHSSNDLVLADRGTVLVTEKLVGSISLDEEAMTVTVQGGQISADADEWLAARGYGLPVIGDHNHITVAGFASVGGISAASHRHGLFVDNVVSLELVDWDGNAVVCSRTERSDLFHAVLLGLGRLGVITTITLRVIRIKKFDTLWANEQTHYRKFEDFLAATEPLMLAPPQDAQMMRALFADLLLHNGKRFGIGQLSQYRETDENPYTRTMNTVAYGALHRIGWAAGRLPKDVDKAMKGAGFASILFSPKYGTIKNVETFSDRVLDATVGEPTRYLVALPSAERYAEFSRRAFDLLLDYRDRFKCMTFIALYVKGIKSAYLGHGDADALFCECLFDIGINPKGMTDEVLDAMVEELDDLCVELGVARYMHSRTTRDPEKRRLIDPNTYYAERLGLA
ncbi:MAG TPA: FAD-binding oxidoreductase [Nocardioidaceae bacterium]|nr:FAD-binding oxidoreductase [Nocardioidaceae bacterium]